MKKIDVLIIGAGPSGLFAGAHITNKSVIILDQKEKTSLKLLMSGGGQCNYTHTGTLKDFLEVYNGHKAFLKVAFKQFFNEDSMAFFKQCGLESFVREDGKVFPKSLSADSIKNILVEKNIANGHSIHSGECVKELIPLENTFQVITDKDVYEATYLIGAFGGCSYPTTGSDGQLFKVIKNLGHDIKALKSSLAPIYTNEKNLLSLQGLSFRDINLQLHREKQQLGTYNGDLLITHFGLSGPVILNNSREFMPEDQLKVQFGNMGKKELDVYLLKAMEASGKQLVLTALKGLDYPKRLTEFLYEESKLSKELKLSELSKIQRKELVNLFCAYEMTIHHVGGYNVAMATTGGVSVEEINRKTMMSKLMPNLFFVGECIDIDGDTGGYNIQWAFTSGFICGQAIEKME